MGLGVLGWFWVGFGRKGCGSFVFWGFFGWVYSEIFKAREVGLKRVVF